MEILRTGSWVKLSFKQIICSYGFKYTQIMRYNNKCLKPYFISLPVTI